MNNKKLSGFTLIELLVVIAIIGMIVTIVTVSLLSARDKARDAKRKFELAQIGRFLSAGSCYLPNTGPGDYDLVSLKEELKLKYPEYTNFLQQLPLDPKIGTETESFYHYLVTEDSQKCALYANLEDVNESVTLPNLTTPTPGGGTGVIESSTTGWNGTNKYFQVSN